MKSIIFLYILVPAISLTGCKSLKEYKLQCGFGYRNILDENIYALHFERDFFGYIKEPLRKDTVEWRYKNGLIYFKYLSTYYATGEPPLGTILPSVGLYNKKGIYIPTDSVGLVIYRIRHKHWDMWDPGHKYIEKKQRNGKEPKIIKRYFGNEKQIEKKLAKAKPQEEIFTGEEPEPIGFYRFYDFWYDVYLPMYRFVHFQWWTRPS